jgi:hypothetical protein
MANSIADQTDRHYPASENEDVVEYRAPSALAVGSLILGVLSPIYVLGSLLIIVPLLGIALALLAFRRIAASDGALVGRSLAVVGLVLATISASTVVGYSLVTRQLRSAQAAEVGREWISLVLSGDTVSAYQLMTGNPPPDPNEDFGLAGNPYNRFLESPAVKGLISFGNKASVRDEGVVGYKSGGNGKLVVRRLYTVSAPPGETDAKDRPREFSVLLQLYRTDVPGMRGMTWRAIPLEKDEASS